MFAALVAAARRRVPDRRCSWPPTSASGSRAWSRPPSGSPRGDYTTTVDAARTAASRAGSREAVNDIAGALADTHDRATIDRLTGVNNRQALLADLFAEVERATRYERPLSVAFVDIDHFKAVNDTYGHAAGDIVLRGVAQTIAANLRDERHDRALRRRGIHAHPDRDGRRGRLGPDREAADARAAPALRRRGRPGDLGHDLDRDRRRGRTAAAHGGARPRRRRRDVLGQVARTQPDLHLRGARRRRPRPARPDLRGRAGASGRDRAAGPRRGDGRADVRARSAPPLSRPAVGAHRLDRRRPGPTAPAAGRRARSTAGGGPAPRRRQGRGAARRSSTSRRP